MSTLRELRIELGWSVSRLADEAGVARQTVSSAERGSSIQAESAKRIAEALSKAYGREIRVLDIQGLNIL